MPPLDDAGPVGLIAPGNIDLSARPMVRNPDGSISTVRSMSFGTDHGEVLVPTVSDDGRLLSDDEARDQFRQTGRHLGIFRTPDAATSYAQWLHHQQDQAYVPRQGMAEGGTPDDDLPPLPPGVEPIPPLPPGVSAMPPLPPGVTPVESYTRENPFVMRRHKNKEEADTEYETIPGGSHYKDPTGEIRIKPKETEAPEPEEKVDYSKYGQPLVKDTGILGAVPAGLVGAGKSGKATWDLITGKTPTVEQPELLAAQPVEWKDFLDPATLAKKTLYGFAESSPTIAAAMFGGVAGTALGGGPETPLGWAGGIAGTATGAAIGSAVQSVGHNFGSALQETGGDAEKAWDLALRRTALGAAGAGIGFSAFGFMPFQSFVKKTIFEAFHINPATLAAGDRQVAERLASGLATPEERQAVAAAATGKATAADIALQAGVVQPGLAVGEKAAQNLAEGKPASEDVTAGVPGAIIGTAGPMAAHQGARMITGRRGETPAARTEPGTTPPLPPGAEPTPAPAPGGPAPSGTPAVGSFVGFDVGNGVERMEIARYTRDGDAILRDSDGLEHPQTAADVARFAVEAPAAPSGPPIGVATPEPSIIPPGTLHPTEETALHDAREALINLAATGEVENPAVEVIRKRSEEVDAENQKKKAGPTSAPEAPAAPQAPQPPAVGETAPTAAPTGEVNAGQPEPLPNVRVVDGLLALNAERANLPEGWRIEPNDDAFDLIAPNGEVTHSQSHDPNGLADIAALYAKADAEKAAAPVAVPEPVEPAPAPAEAPPAVGDNPAPPTPTAPPNAPTVTDEKHTKTGEDLFAVRFPTKPDIAGFREKARHLGGKWSSFRGGGMEPGWMFKTREAADRFAEWSRSHLGMPQRLADAEAAGRVAGEAGILRAINRDPVGQSLMQGAPDVSEADRVLKAWIQGWHEGQKKAAPTEPEQTQTAATESATNPEPAVENPVETGDNRPDIGPASGDYKVVSRSGNGREVWWIQRPDGSLVGPGPRGTAVDSRAEAERLLPEYAEAGKLKAAQGWEEIGKNHIGQTLYEDQRGVRSIVENGVRRSEPVGLRPTKAGMEFTTDRTNRPEYQIAEPHPANPREVEYRAEEPAAGDAETLLARVEFAQTLLRGEDSTGPDGKVYRYRRTDGDSRGELFEVKDGEAERIGIGPTPIVHQLADDLYSTGAPEPEYVPSGMDPELYRLRGEMNRAATETEVEPSDGQKEAGNYKKGRVKLAPGLEFVMENPVGSRRHGVDANGEKWGVDLPADYGYFARTEGADSTKGKAEGVDAYVGDELLSPTAYVIDQHRLGGGFDEHKVMYGFDSWAKARETYEDAFSDGRGAERIGSVTPMSIDQLREWLRTGDTKNPVNQQAFKFEGVVGEQVRHESTPRNIREAEQKSDVDHRDNPQVRIADDVADLLGRKGVAEGVQQVSALDLQRLGEKHYGSKLAEGKFTRAELYDALELGVNKFIQKNRELFDPSGDINQARRAVELLEKIKNDLPTQTVRAGEKELMQQFSTPPDYAFAAAWMAKIEPGRDRVMEPSAGTGSLAVHAMNARPASVMVNELSATRAPLVESLGPDRAFRENAEQLHNILPDDAKPTVVVMNPPFSASGERMPGKRLLDIGAQHVEAALKTLEPGGRLVAIVGRGMGQNMEAAFRQGTGAHFAGWWQRIGGEYDVRANVGVPGDVYTKYGTSFGTRLLVIDKNPPSGRPPVIAEARDIPDLLNRLDEVRNDRQPIRESGQPLAGESGREEAPAGGQGGARPAPPVSGAAAEPGVRGGTPGAGAGPEVSGGTRGGGAGNAQPEHQPRPRDEVVPEQSERPEPGGAERHPEAGAGEGPELEGGRPEPDGVAVRPEGGAGSVLPVGGGSRGGGGRGSVVKLKLTPEEIETINAARGRGEETTDPRLPTEKANPDEVQADPGPGSTESVYEPYKPQRITVTGAKEHPGNLVQSAAMATVVPPDTSYSPKLPKSLIESGALSDAQLESIVYAGNAHSQMLPEQVSISGEPKEERRGYFIGDGTGVGKGREVAGIILDNWNQGRRKHLWVSEKKPLIKDAQRDWGALAPGPLKAKVFDLSKTKAGDSLKAPDGIAFTTYDTLKSSEQMGKDENGKTIKGKSRLAQMVEWLGKDFDGVIAFDESHNLSNSIEMNSGRGARKAAEKALAGIELQNQLPKARVIYVSATGATEVSNLAYAERLGLWGHGTAFPDKRTFISQIASGGIAAMELVARDMKAMGSYISRNLSYDDVKYDRVEHILSPNQKDAYNRLAEAWQVVLQNINKALEVTAPNAHMPNPKPDSKAKSAALSAFWGAHQRFFNQIITSMQMPTIIKGIEQDMKEGKQAVIQLVNTNEASQKRALAKIENPEELEDLDMTPRDQLMQLIEHSFPVHQHEEYTDENGNVRSRPVMDSNGTIVENKEAVAMREKLLDEIGSRLDQSVAEGPLEMLINHFGHDNVAEVTGRKQRVVRKEDEQGNLRTMIEARPASANITEADAFQNGKKKVLVFSQAGGTGRSYHADNTSPSRNAQRSHYLAQPGWRADIAIQGFGRTHRTNQGSAPIFHLVTTDLQGQRRFISSIARRLAQLGALTKGERRAGEQGMFSARDNLESQEAKDALYSFFRDLYFDRVPEIQMEEFERQTGLKLTDDQGNLKKELPEITQFLNRMLSLKFDMQNEVFGAFETRLIDQVDRAAADGTLDVGTETLMGDKITKEEERTVHTDPQSGAETKYVRLSVQNRTNPASFANIDQGRMLMGGRSAAFYVRNKQSGKVYAVAEAQDKTDARTGQITPQYRLADPLDYHYTERRSIDGYKADERWERIDDKKQAEALWNAQLEKVPEFRTRDTHLITGVILPIWDRVGGTPKIYRTTTDAGEKMLGRVVPEKQIAATLKALGAEEAMKQFTPQDVVDKILDGDRARLANGWTLARTYVANEPRIEIRGPDFYEQSELQAAGVFVERIGYKTRFFVPTGDRAADVISKITQRRPISEFAGEGEGLAQPRAKAIKAIDVAEEPQLEHANDLTKELTDWSEDHEDGPHEAAREFVTHMGRETGNEYYGGIDAITGEVVDAGTSDHPSEVRFNDATMKLLFTPGGKKLDWHHNHPSDLPVSTPDLSMLAAPNMRTIVAHGQDGETISMAQMTPEGRAWLDELGAVDGQKKMIEMSIRAGDIVDRGFAGLVDAGRITEAQADHWTRETANTAMAGAGFIDYISSSALPQWAYPYALRAARELQAHLPWQLDPEAIFDRTHRSAGAVSASEGMGRLSRSNEADARAGRSAGPGSDQGSRERAEPAPKPEGRLAEDRPATRDDFREEMRALENPRDFEPPRPEPAREEAVTRVTDPAAHDLIDEAVRDTVTEALAGVPKGSERTPDSFWRKMLGSAWMRSPDAESDHFFNFLNKNFTTAMAKGSLDDRSARKMGAELRKFRAAAELVHKYRNGLESWQGKPKETWDKQFRAMEILTLQGRQVPLDGRSIIVENTDQPYAALTRKGDVVRLTTPEEIKMFADFRNTMDTVWKDVVAETAKQFGWTGEPTARAIYKAAEESHVGSEQRRLERAAKIVAAIEYQHRTSYLPLMRTGDYFLRVKPSRPSEDWNGEGFPPTTLFKLIDSLSPSERAVGGIRSGVPKRAQDAISTLRETFPDGEYDIEHGYMFKDADSVRDLDVPAVDKLMMLASNDVISHLRDRLEGAGMEGPAARRAAKAEYDQIENAILDQIYEQRVPGFKRHRQGIPGYDSDFGQSTSRYFSWLASHIAGIRYRPEIEAANQLIDSHPDPRTRAYWRDQDRRQEDYNDQMSGPLAKVRQAAFYWLLGANAATTVKILLHGPLRGIPVLTTGLGAQGRMLALGDYLAASKDMLKGLGVGKDGIEVNVERGARNGAELALLRDSLAKGILHPQTMEELAAVKNRGEQALTEGGRFFQRVLDIWGSNVSAADRMVRGSMLLSAYRIAQRGGMDRINQVWSKDRMWANTPEKTPEAFAQFMVDKTVGVWGDINRMPVLRSQLGGLMGQFKVYELGYLSNMWQMMTRMGPEGKVSAALMMGGLAMMGGAFALPFAGDAEAALESMYQLITGAAPDLKTDIKRAIDALFGGGSGDVIAYGAARPVTGIDWSGIGFGEIVGRNMQGPLDSLGAAFSTFVGGPLRAYERLHTGQSPESAGYELLPNALKHMFGAMYPEIPLSSAKTGYRSLATEEVGDQNKAPVLSQADRVKMAAGFRPQVQAENFEDMKRRSHLHDSYKNAIILAENTAANLLARGDTAGARKSIAHASDVIGAGQKVGAFTKNQAVEYRRHLNQKYLNRMHPEIPNRMQQRMGALDKAS